MKCYLEYSRRWKACLVNNKHCLQLDLLGIQKFSYGYGEVNLLLSLLNKALGFKICLLLLLFTKILFDLWAEFICKCDNGDVHNCFHRHHHRHEFSSDFVSFLSPNSIWSSSGIYRASHRYECAYVCLEQKAI